MPVILNREFKNEINKIAEIICKIFLLKNNDYLSTYLKKDLTSKIYIIVKEVYKIDKKKGDTFLNVLEKIIMDCIETTSKGDKDIFNIYVEFGLNSLYFEKREEASKLIYNNLIPELKKYKNKMGEIIKINIFELNKIAKEVSNFIYDITVNIRNKRIS